uniref:Ig-like domain-containing protein n=1 Tax=Myripristis murdjan TaxID=586833 RepID=A0A667W995_9TELE
MNLIVVSDVLCVTVVQGHYGATYTSTKICALKGSTVDIDCNYTYPNKVRGQVVTVRSLFWFSGKRRGVDLKFISEYASRVEFHNEHKYSRLRIKNLRKTDSTVYMIRCITNIKGGKFNGIPGVSLTVTDLQVHVTKLNSVRAELNCHSICSPVARPSYIWYKNGQNVKEGTSSSYTLNIYPEDSYSCAVKGHEDYRSPAVYAPKVPSVLVRPSGEIVEGSSVTLNCSSDANPAANYTWYKSNGNPDQEAFRIGPQLHFVSIQSSDSGEFYCTVKNELGEKTSDSTSVDVKYPPKSSSVLASPSGEIMEGSLVTLTCSSDANPPVDEYTWYKENQTLLQGPERSYNFTSISSEDTGTYHCQSENQHGQINSSSHFIDVQCKQKILEKVCFTYSCLISLI